MITVFIVALWAIGAIAVASATFGVCLAYLTWRDHQRDIGYGYGSIDGYKVGDDDGYARGYSMAKLDAVLDEPTVEDQSDEVLALVNRQALNLLGGEFHDAVGEEGS